MDSQSSQSSSNSQSPMQSYSSPPTHTPKKRKLSSFVWNHFAAGSNRPNGFIECNWCEKQYSQKTSTAILKKHLNQYHQDKISENNEVPLNSVLKFIINNNLPCSKEV
jgi:hypothetical protein